MPLEDSPSLEHYQDGLPETPPGAAATSPPPQQGGVRGWRAAIVVLALVVVSLGGWNVFGAGTPPFSEDGVGAVVGMVVDVDGRPTAADVLVEGTDIRARVGPDGRIDLKNVPAGRRTVLVGAMYIVQAYPVTVHDGAVADLGQVRLPGRAREGGSGRLEWR